MFTRLRIVITVLVVAGLSSASLGESPAGPKSLIRVDVTSAEVVTGLKQVLRVWDQAGTADQGRSADLVVTDQQRRDLEAAGVPFEVIIRDIELRSAGARAAYQSFSQMETGLAAMAAAYPTITELTSIGTSYEGRDIWCLEISDNAGVDEGEVGVVFMGLHHAREWPSLAVSYDIADRLTSGYGSDQDITDMVNGRRIWVIPCVNPDGYVYCHDQGHDWRQNRHYFPQFGTYGVDLNRNYAGSSNGNPNGSWGSIGDAYSATSHNPAQSVYVGPGPCSELETQAVRDFLDPLDITIMITYHTHGEWVLWPWGSDASTQTDDNTLMTSIGQGLASAIGGYTPTQATGLYPTTGDTTDWAYGYFYYELGRNMLPYTVEIGTSFHPDPLPQSYLDDNWNGAWYVLQQAAGAASQMTPFVLPPILSAPPVDADGDYTISWAQKNPDAGATTYALQELTGLSKLTDGAESGDGNWDMQGFAVSTSRAHSGSRSYKSPGGEAQVGTMSTADPLPVEAGDELTFWIWYDIEEDWDMGFVEVSIDGRYYEVLDAFTGSSGWVQKTYSLDAYAGHSIYIQFRYTTDGYVTEEGMYVDDIQPVASWSSITTLSSSISGTSYPITGRSDGDYFYRVKGSSPTRGFGEYSDVGMTRVYEYLSDSNQDGDHDLHDFGDFQACFAGEGQSVSSSCAAWFDFDVDNDVDPDDLAVFDACLSGPDGTTPPGCPF